MTEMMENALRKVAALSREEQDALAAQILEALEDEASWREKLAQNPEKLHRMVEEAQREHLRGETRPIDEIL